MFSSTILLIAITNQKSTYIFCLFIDKRQRAIQCPTSVLTINCLYKQSSFQYILNTLDILSSFRLYIWSQISFSNQNHTNHNLLSIWHNLQVSNVEFLIPTQQQYLQYREKPEVEKLIDKGMISVISKIFMKERNVVVVR